MSLYAHAKSFPGTKTPLNKLLIFHFKGIDLIMAQDCHETFGFLLHSYQ